MQEFREPSIGELDAAEHSSSLDVNHREGGRGIRITYTCDDAPPSEDFLVGESEPENFAVGKRPVGTRGAQLNVSRFTVAELARAAHQYDLLDGAGPEALATRSLKVHIDTAHCGESARSSHASRLLEFGCLAVELED